MRNKVAKRLRMETEAETIGFTIKETRQVYLQKKHEYKCTSRSRLIQQAKSKPVATKAHRLALSNRKQASS